MTLSRTCRTLTTNLLFGKSGVQNYFTSYVSKVIPDSALAPGWVSDEFEYHSTKAWFLDEEGLVVNEDLHGNRLKKVTMRNFIAAALDDQSETDSKQWPQDLLDWADATQFDAVVVYRD